MEMSKIFWGKKRTPTPEKIYGSFYSCETFLFMVNSMVLFQLIVNAGMVLGLMPITGIPLPFVTHGGAALVSVAIGLGIMQSVNIRQSRAEW